MPTIPQRQLRNEVSDVLRRAEHGERFTVTVDGRPVAELGPLATARRPAAAARLQAVLTDSPVDPGWTADLQRLRAEEHDVAHDPWAG